MIEFEFGILATIGCSWYFWKMFSATHQNSVASRHGAAGINQTFLNQKLLCVLKILQNLCTREGFLSCTSCDKISYLWPLP